MKYLFLTLLSLNICLSFSQQHIGYHYDASGIPLYDYFDQLTYKPKDNLSITYNSMSFEPGYYYSNDGVKHTGEIKFAHKKIWFKENGKGNDVKLKTDVVNSFVVGIDSFCLVRNFLFNGDLVTENEFAQFITTFNGTTVLKHMHFVRDFVSGATTIKTNYLIKKDNEETWKNLSDKKRFKEISLAYFGDNEHVKSKIVDETFNKDNIISMVKTSEYLYNVSHEQPLFFNAYWQEIPKPTKSGYVGIIEHAHDSIYTISYYQGDILLYKISYSSFYPNSRNGLSSAYYQYGDIRKEIQFENDSIVGIKEYRPDGSIMLDYSFTNTKAEILDDSDSFHVYYNTITDSIGKIVNVMEGNHTSVLVDTVHDLRYYRKYNDGLLNESYRLQASDTVFQIVNPNFDLRLEKIQKRISNNLNDYSGFEEASKFNAQGFVLVKFVINEKGYVDSYELLNHLTPDVNKWINRFIKNYITGEDFTHFKFRTFKKGKTKYKYEVVIPFEFSINRLYRKPWKYYNNHWHWHNQHMMHQMHMQQMQQIHQQQINNMHRYAPTHF